MSTPLTVARSARRRLRRSSAVGFYSRHLNARDLVLDIGANLGEHTAAILAAGARVVAVEPQWDLLPRLQQRCPDAHVRGAAVSDRHGEATLFTSATNSEIATLNPDWPARYDDEVRSAGWKAAEWGKQQTVPVVTLDELVDEYGQPQFVKIDVEGLEDKVLAGLSTPVDQFLFEVHSGLPGVALRAFDQLARLGRYEYRMMEYGCWEFRRPMSAAGILARLPDQGDVHARRVG